MTTQKTLKNDEEKKRSDVTKIIDCTDDQILKLIFGRYRNDGLSKDELELLCKIHTLGAMSEQRVRFTSVHKYFDENILPKVCVNEAPEFCDCSRDTTPVSYDNLTGRT